MIQGYLVNGSVGRIVRFSTVSRAKKNGIKIAEIERVESKAHWLPSGSVWPVVQFICGPELLCIPQEFSVDNTDGKMEARRDQVRASSEHICSLARNYS